MNAIQMPVAIESIWCCPSLRTVYHHTHRCEIYGLGRILFVIPNIPHFVWFSQIIAVIRQIVVWQPLAPIPGEYGMLVFQYLV